MSCDDEYDEKKKKVEKKKKHTHTQKEIVCRMRSNAIHSVCGSRVGWKAEPFELSCLCALPCVTRWVVTPRVSTSRSPPGTRSRARCRRRKEKPADARVRRHVLRNSSQSRGSACTGCGPETHRLVPHLQSLEFLRGFDHLDHVERAFWACVGWNEA